MTRNFPMRIRVIGGVLILLALILVIRLYSIDILNARAYKEKADRQYQRPSDTLFNRGDIYFQNRDGSLVGAATLKNGFTIAIVPKLITNIDTTYLAISKIVAVDEKQFREKAAKKSDPYEEIAKRVEEDKGRAVDALNIPGVLIYKDRWRFYPGDKMASQVIGLIGYQGDKLAGRYGLERYFDDVLARNETDLYSNFFAQIFGTASRKLTKGEPLEGNLVTTIEPAVTLFLERELEQINTKWSSTHTGGIIMDPKTGEIIALSSFPTFDPNNVQNEKKVNIFANPLIEDVYEMGSIVKPLTMAAGLDSGAVTAKTTYDDKGFTTLNGSTFSNFDGKGRGVVSMQEVLNQSLNTGAAFVVSRMGKQKFAEYIRNFGIGEESGIDLPNEAAGIIDNLKSPRDIEYATASFGQGIAMSPLATIRALGTLANGGKLPNPHIVKKIQYEIGVSKTITPDEERRVIKPETAEEITRMLVEVVDKALLNGSVKNPHYSVAAKTGTAQIPDPKGKYYDDRYLHSFFGYFPAYAPRFIVLLYTVDPKARYASETLTHPFIDIANFLTNYYEIPPDR